MFQIFSDVLKIETGHAQLIPAVPCLTEVCRRQISTARSLSTWNAAGSDGVAEIQQESNFADGSPMFTTQNSSGKRMDNVDQLDRT